MNSKEPYETKRSEEYIDHAPVVRALLRSRSAELRRVLSQSISSFEDMGRVEFHDRKKGDSRTIYIDRGSPVLAVAHLDSVQSPQGFWMTNSHFAASTIDNRLGAWLMLYGLPALGIRPDVLLTEDEEMGMSTAQFFKTDKEYNWAFSFDRTGDDVACYQYLNNEVEDAMWEYGLFATSGSYSDVADLEIGVKGFNFGCGMYNYHAAGAYCNIKELSEQVSRFMYWWNANEQVSWPHKGKGRVRWEWSESNYSASAYRGEYKNYNAMSDEEWDAYLNNFVKCTDGVWRPKTDPRAQTTALVKGNFNQWLSGEQRWERELLTDPILFLDGEMRPEDWLDIHALAPSEYDPRSSNVDRCDGCNELFVWQDLVWVDALECNVCKSCFYYTKSG